MEFSASAMMELIDAVFEGRQTANKYDVVQKAKFYPLGRDGERAIEILPAKRYTKEQLSETLAQALIEAVQKG